MAGRLCHRFIFLVILLIACTTNAALDRTTPQPPAGPIITATSTFSPSPAPAPTPPDAPSFTVSPSPSPAPTAIAAPTPSCGDSKGALSIQSFNSATLHRAVEYSLYLPPCYATDAARTYPVLYLLHGARADHTQWPDLNVAPEADVLIEERRAAPFVVLMPDGDYRQGEDYAAFVLHDLMPHVEESYHVKRDRASHAIGGLSAGGDWALLLALTHPELFSAVGAHSAVADQAPRLLDAATQHHLRFYLDVGSADPLRPGMESLAAALQAKGFAPFFHIYPGGHDRPYWRSHAMEYLSFYAAEW